MDPSNQYPAEQQLLDALRAGVSCDLGDPGSDPTVEEMTRWDDPHRKIRAEFLRPLLLRVHPEVKPAVLALHGGHITGQLDLAGAVIDPRMLLTSCKIDAVCFREAIFTSDASFAGSVFAGDAKFDSPTFMGCAQFDRVTFSQSAVFGRAHFTGPVGFSDATFAGRADFHETNFADHANFCGATYDRSPRFTKTTFTGVADFREVNFTSQALFIQAAFASFGRFEKVTFAMDVHFHDATFGGDALFHAASFEKDALFNGATFGKSGQFRDATFAGDAHFNKTSFVATADFRRAAFTQRVTFDGVWAQRLDLRDADLHSSELGTVLALDVSLDGANFHRRVQLTALSSTISMRHVHLLSGGHLQIHSAVVVADGADFLSSTIMSDPGYAVTSEFAEQVRIPTLTEASLRSQARDSLRRIEQNLESLARNLTRLKGRPARISSLRAANVSDLVLSSMVLDDCRFAGAHGLDELRIDADCHLESIPKLERWRPWRYARRRIIAEERDWRRFIAEERNWRHRQAIWGRVSDPEYSVPPPASEIAGIYRDLRKGLEDIKNEPGAADFYYGEVEMRRLGHRKKADRSAEASWAERWLLHAYWAVSGYGLRAWRAFAAAAVLILTAALIFSTIGIAEPSGTTAKAESVDLGSGTINYPTQESTIHGFGEALELAGRNSIALLRNPGPVPELNFVGTITDVLLRLLTPVLLGFGLLALRGRTKR